MVAPDQPGHVAHVKLDTGALDVRILVEVTATARAVRLVVYA